MGKQQKNPTQSEALFLHMCEPQNWWERYCSHVMEPGQYIVVSIVLLVLFMGFGVFMFVETMPLQIENLDRIEISFVDSTLNEDGVLHLRSDGYTGEFFFIADAAHLEDQMLQACKSGSVFSAYAEYYKDADRYNIAVLLDSDGTELVSLADTNAAIRHDRIIFMGITAVILIFWAVFIFGLFYVGAYPERHPRLVYLFYRKDAIYF